MPNDPISRRAKLAVDIAEYKKLVEWRKQHEQPVRNNVVPIRNKGPEHKHK